jgi:hypothetical protein
MTISKMKFHQQIPWISAIFQIVPLCLAAEGESRDVVAIFGVLFLLNVMGFCLFHFRREPKPKWVLVVFGLTMLVGPWLAVLGLMLI